MNLFEFTVVNAVFTFFPILIYMIYVAYSSNIDKKENNLFLELALFSSIYLVIRYGTKMDFENLPILIINVPLIIAYMKKRPVGIILISVFLIMYYHYSYDCSWGILVLEYIYYLIIYMIKENNKIKEQLFIPFFLIIKAIFYGYFFFYNYQDNVIVQELFINIFSMIFLLIVVTYISVLLFKKGEEILKLHMTIKELEKEKQIQMSLFQITHEIKNPIAVCKGYLDMFDVNNPEHSQKYIPILKEEIARTLILLQDFLAINKIKIEKDVLDINLLLEETITSLGALFKEKMIEISTNIIDDEIYMNGDYNRLKQVFINLLKNSVEAMTNNEKHKLRIEVNDLKNEIEIKIIDNGIGINEENLKKMTNPFFSTKKTGTGLGVYLSNEIIKAHNGKIDFESNKKGTIVTVKLPTEVDIK